MLLRALNENVRAAHVTKWCKTGSPCPRVWSLGRAAWDAGRNRVDNRRRDVQTKLMGKVDFRLRMRAG